jgi:hypothetical protein
VLLRFLDLMDLDRHEYRQMLDDIGELERGALAEMHSN